jgi:hypothetical protein
MSSTVFRSKPSPHKGRFISQYVVGDEVPVTVDGREFMTIFHGNGEQSFKGNPILQDIFSEELDQSAGGLKFSSYSHMLGEGFDNGSYSVDDLLSYYTSIGFSVPKLDKLRFFPNISIRNPVWEEHDFTLLTSAAWVELMALIDEPYEHAGNDAVRHIFNVVSSGEWKSSNGSFITGTETIDRVVVDFIYSRNIDPYTLETTTGMSEELDRFISHLRLKPYRFVKKVSNA